MCFQLLSTYGALQITGPLVIRFIRPVNILLMAYKERSTEAHFS